MPIARTPHHGEAKTRRMVQAIITTIDAIDNGERDDGVLNAALGGVIGLLARRMGDPEEWISGMYAVSRRVANGEFQK